MKRIELSSYFSKLCHRADNEIERYVLTSEPEALHKLRVTLKKTDTLLLTLRFADENFDYKKFRYPLKKIFNHAGLIREAQEMQSRLVQIHRPENLAEAFSRFEEIRISERALFVYKAGIYLRGLKKERKLLNEKVRQLEAKQVKMFLKYQLRRLNHLINKQDSEQLHNARKKIKRMLHANEFLSEMKLKGFFSDTTLSQWDVLQDAIGQWHDRKEMFAYLVENSTLPNVSMVEQQSGLDKDAEQLWKMLRLRMKIVMPELKKKENLSLTSKSLSL